MRPAGTGGDGTGDGAGYDGEGDGEGFDVEPGSFVKLPPGYDVTFSKPEDVGGNFAIFD